MRKLFACLLWLDLLTIGAALAQPSPPPLNLTATSPITVTPSGAGNTHRIIACPTCGTGGSGTVTSVGVSVPSSLLTVGGSPVTTSGTIALGLANQSANTVLGALTLTTPSALSLPSCSGASSALTWTTGTGFGCNTISGGSGTVTSVATNNGLTGGTITTAGTIGLASIANQTILANVGGSSGPPSATSLSNLLDATIGSTNGDLMVRNPTSWQALGPSTGNYLQSFFTGGNNTVRWNAVTSYDHLNYEPGVLGSVNNNIAGFAKFTRAATLISMTASINVQSCSVSPTIAILECSTSTTCASPTTMASVTPSATGTAYPATISSSAITAGDYIAWELTAGTCSSLDIHGNAEVSYTD